MKDDRSYSGATEERREVTSRGWIHNPPLGRPNPHTRRLPLAASVWIGLLLLLGTTQPQAQDPKDYSKELQVKAAFLVKFPSFVEWPEGTFADPKAPVIIGVIGNDPFGPLLDLAAEKSGTENRSLQIKRVTDPNNLGPIHVLYVSPIDRNESSALLARISQTPILTVGDHEAFVREGGMVKFVTETKDATRVRFEINLQAARKAGLKLSPKILKVAIRIVGED